MPTDQNVNKRRHLFLHSCTANLRQAPVACDRHPHQARSNVLPLGCSVSVLFNRNFVVPRAWVFFSRYTSLWKTVEFDSRREMMGHLRVFSMTCSQLRKRKKRKTLGGRRDGDRTLGTSIPACFSRVPFCPPPTFFRASPTPSRPTLSVLA